MNRSPSPPPPADVPSPVLVRQLVDLTVGRLPRGLRVAAPAGWARRLAAAGHIPAASLVDPDGNPAGVAPPDGEPPPDAALLVADELARAGEHAEELLSRTVDGLAPGGHLVATVANALHPSVPTDHRAWRPTDVPRLLGGRGVEVAELWAPGATASLRGNPPDLDDPGDREPSLLGLVPRLFAVGRTPGSPERRSATFFATLPTKTVASATLVRHPDDGRLLTVYDSFKGRWTIPGGVVDADEDPATAAVRETREESGLTVRVTGLAGMFHASWPDRLVCVFTAEPRDDLRPAPLHGHEIGDARWMAVDEALRRVGRSTAEQIRRGLAARDGDGVRVWRQ